MNSAWQADSGNLACRWSGLFEQSQPTSAILHELSEGAAHNAVVPTPNFAAHSPVGSGEWFVPWNQRWSIPTRHSF